MSFKYVGKRRDDHSIEFWVETDDGKVYEITRYARYPGYQFDWGANEKRQKERVNLAYSILADWFLRHHRRHLAGSKVVLEQYNLPEKFATEWIAPQEYHSLLISHRNLVRFDSRERDLETQTPDWLSETVPAVGWPACPECGSQKSYTNIEDHPLTRHCSDCTSIYTISKEQLVQVLKLTQEQYEALKTRGGL